MNCLGTFIRRNWWTPKDPWGWMIYVLLLLPEAQWPHLYRLRDQALYLAARVWYWVRSRGIRRGRGVRDAERALRFMCVAYGHLMRDLAERDAKIAELEAKLGAQHKDQPQQETTN